MTLKAPYPYFGGKSAAAALVWERFGNPANYIEPFFGSGAVLLARPGEPDLELVNDLDGLIVNFWRAIQSDPETTAYYADHPAFENDLHARHAWLVGRKESLQEQLEGDPDYYNAKIAGWWVWGMALWIGSGFCSGGGSWGVVEGRLQKTDNKTAGVAGQRPQLTTDQGIKGVKVARQLPKVVDRSIRASYILGAGIARQLPRINGVGVKRNRLELSGSPKGVHRKLIHTADAGRGGHRDQRRGVYAYFEQLQARFSRIRVTCGDWTRVVTPAVLNAKTPCALFIDPPYHADREANLYVNDDVSVSIAARNWAIENGSNPALRIAFCGYEDDFVFPDGWATVAWKANGGYSNQGDGRRDNPHKERIWFSPYCLKPGIEQLKLWEMP